MPQWNECGIYDEKCRNRTCDHPTNTSKRDACQSAGPHGIGKYDCKCPVIVPGGAQCRTMASQRPCGMHVCTRPECKGSKPATKNGSTGSVSVPQSEGDTEPTYTLTGLSARNVERLEQALRMLRRTYTRDSAGYRETSELGARVSDLKWSE